MVLERAPANGPCFSSDHGIGGAIRQHDPARGHKAFRAARNVCCAEATDARVPDGREERRLLQRQFPGRRGYSRSALPFIEHTPGGVTRKRTLC
jgi:hypothetical protein